GCVVKYGSDLRLSVRRSTDEEAADVFQMSWLAGGSQELPHFRVKGCQADAVGLLHDEVAEGRGRGAGQIVLRDLAGPVAHRFAGLDQKPADEVGFELVLLEVEAFGAAVDLPVDVADVIAGDVFAMLSELDREPVVLALVPAGDEPLDRLPGAQLQRADAGQGFRV